MVEIMAAFLINRGGLLHRLLFACMLTVALSGLSVAPDGFASECIEFAEPSSFNNPNQKVLLDTQFYPSSDLLTIEGQNGLWISLDFDMTTGDFFGKVRNRESEQGGNRESVRVYIVSLYTFLVVD